MKKSYLLGGVCVFASVLINTAANGASIFNLSTGIDGAGSLIPYGQPDVTWQLTDAPAGVLIGGSAIVADHGFFSLEPNARWISGSELLATVDAPWGYYTYQTSFNAGGFTDLVIDGSFGSDNRLIDVRINGVLAMEGPNKYGPCGGTGCIEFSSPIPFLINNQSLFVSDLNTIEFVIENQGPTDTNPTSFILSASVSGSAIPIPPAVWLFGSGLLGFIGVASHKKAVAINERS